MTSDSRLTTHDSPALLRNALTVDVEDYFHVSAFAGAIKPEDWDSYESRIEQNTHRLLDIFDEHGVKATFFVLGWVAERYPALVRGIAARGHEAGCHGYGHELIYEQTPAQFRQDTIRAKRLLEDIVQTSVYGYRAASFSITKRSEWALDVVADAGFLYDSSIFPIRHDKYGFPGTPNRPYRLRTSNGSPLLEFPLTTVQFLGFSLPVAGGGYFRLYPYAFTRWNLERINRQGRPFIFYIHPWEIDPDQPRVRASLLSTFRHYNNLDKSEVRLVRLLKDFQFGTLESVLADLDL